MEISRLVLDPQKEARKIGLRGKRGTVSPDPCQRGMIELAVERAMANGVKLHRVAPAARLGHEVVLFDPLA